MTAPDANHVLIAKAASDTTVTATVAPVCATCQWFVPDATATIGLWCANQPKREPVEPDHTCGQWKWRMLDRGNVPVTAYKPLDDDLTVYAWV